MIKEFVEKKIAEFFLEQNTCLNSSAGYIKSYKRWRKDFKCFGEDIFRKWLASRSRSAVQQLLDNGMSAENEQIVVQELEKMATDYFSQKWNSFEKSILVPIKLLGISLVLWTILFGILLGRTTDALLNVSWINLWFSGLCLAWSRMLFLISKKVLTKKSYDFITHFFNDVEKQWTKLQEQHNKDKGV